MVFPYRPQTSHKVIVNTSHVGKVLVVQGISAEGAPNCVLVAFPSRSSPAIKLYADKEAGNFLRRPPLTIYTTPLSAVGVILCTITTEIKLI